MDAMALAVQFIIQGYVVVPDVVGKAELEGMQEAFEGLASRLGKRAFSSAEIVEVPELVNFIGHPGVMPVIEAFYRHFDHEPAVACLHLCRDIYDPAAPPFDGNMEAVKQRLHSDVGDGNQYNFAYPTLNLSVASFLWLDDTYPDAGSLMQVPGSHHLVQSTPQGGIKSPTVDFVRQHCSVELVSAKAGDVVLQRGFNIHGTGPEPRHKRRQIRADYTPMALYHHLTLDGRQGLHQQFSDETRAMLPVERQRYFCDA